MTRIPTPLVAALVVATGLALTTAASASSVTVALDPFTGDPIELELTLDDDAGDGTIHGRLEVTAGIGDIRGLFLDFVDGSLADGIQVTGVHVTGFDTGDVIDLGDGNNVQGDGTPCPCDVGMEFGTPGIGTDDLQMVEFVLSHVTELLDLSVFQDQSVAARVTSVGSLEIDGKCEDGRDGSSKLAGVVPEPGTALLLGIGLAMLRLRRRAPR